MKRLSAPFALLAFAALADPVTISGAAVDVQNVKLQGSKGEGTLARDTDLALFGATVPLKGGGKIEWSTRDNTFHEGVLRAPLTIDVAGAKWNLEAGSRIECTPTAFHTVQLAGNHEIRIEGASLTAGPGTAQFGSATELHNFRSAGQDFSYGGYKISAPARTYLGLAYSGAKVLLWSVQPDNSPHPSIELWGALRPASVISFDRREPKLERVKFSTSPTIPKISLGGTEVEISEARYKDGNLETVTLRQKATVQLDGAEQSVNTSTKLFVSADLRFASMTREGLAKAMAGAAPPPPAPAIAPPPAGPTAVTPAPPPPGGTVVPAAAPPPPEQMRPSRIKR